jgi:hypothetical protein
MGIPSAHAASSSLPPAVPAKHGPCQGPFCSGSPLAPLAPVPPAPVQGDQWAFVPSLLCAASPDPNRPVSKENTPSPVRHGAAIYHPPR